VQWASEQVTLRANLGRYGRLPSLTERYGNTGLLLATLTLCPSGTNADVGATGPAKASDCGFSLDGSLFAVWARTSFTSSWPRPTCGRKTWGAHASWVRKTSATVDLATPFSVFRADHFHRCRDQENVSGVYGKQLSFRPRLRAYARPELRDLPLAGRWRWGLYADLDVTSGN